VMMITAYGDDENREQSKWSQWFLNQAWFYLIEKTQNILE
jgi:hypothetical protein